MPELQIQLEPGQLVSLKSGGPLMTIHHRTADDDYTCQWFDGGELHVGRFARSSLYLRVPVTKDRPAKESPRDSRAPASDGKTKPSAPRNPFSDLK